TRCVRPTLARPQNLQDNEPHTLDSSDGVATEVQKFPYSPLWAASPGDPSKGYVMRSSTGEYTRLPTRRSWNLKVQFSGDSAYPWTAHISFFAQQRENERASTRWPDCARRSCRRIPSRDACLCSAAGGEPRFAFSPTTHVQCSVMCSLLRTLKRGGHHMATDC